VLLSINTYKGSYNNLTIISLVSTIWFLSNLLPC